MRSPAKPLGSLGPQWIEGALITYLDLVVWVDTRKECGSHVRTSVADADPLRKRRLLSTLFANAHLLGGADIGYLALQPLST